MIRRRITVSNVVAFLALFVALSAGSYAAISLPANSVGSKQIKAKAVTNKKLGNNAVSTPKIQSNAIDSSKVKDGSLVGTDINLATLGKVPAAANADAARISVVKQASSAGNAAPNGGFSSATATCEAGLSALGGGASVADPSNEFVIDTYPSGANGWTARVANLGGSGGGFTVYAVCGPAASNG